MLQPLKSRPALIYAKEVLSDRINVYQVQGEDSFDALSLMCSFLTRVENYHIFAELWVSAHPSTQQFIGHNPTLGSVRTIFTADEGASSQFETERNAFSRSSTTSRATHVRS